MKDRKYYKTNYIICFYDKDGEFLLHSFDNIYQILRFQKKEINRKNANICAVQIYKANKRKNHFCKFLNGQPMSCYLINIKEE